MGTGADNRPTSYHIPAATANIIRLAAPLRVHNRVCIKISGFLTFRGVNYNERRLLQMVLRQIGHFRKSRRL